MVETFEEGNALDKVDLTMLDESTIAALYEEFKDIPIETPPPVEETDFADGQ